MNLITISLGSGSASISPWLTVFTGLAVALIGGIILFGLNWLREHLTAKWKRESEAEVLAFSLMAQLDKLIAECADVVNDFTYEDPKTGYTESTIATPKIEFPDNWNWSVFDKRLQFQIRSLPNKIDVADRSVSHIGEYGQGPPYYSDAFEESEYRFSFIGLEVHVIIEQLARVYGVPRLDRVGWDPAEDFRSKIVKIEKSREAAKVWPIPDILKPKISIEELEKRRLRFNTALDAAKAKLTPPIILSAET